METEEEKLIVQIFKHFDKDFEKYKNKNEG